MALTEWQAQEPALGLACDAAAAVAMPCLLPPNSTTIPMVQPCSGRAVHVLSGGVVLVWELVEGHGPPPWWSCQSCQLYTPAPFCLAHAKQLPAPPHAMSSPLDRLPQTRPKRRLHSKMATSMEHCLRAVSSCCACMLAANCCAATWAVCLQDPQQLHAHCKGCFAAADALK